MMSRRDYHCHRCNAKPGENCRNYAGKGCTPHRDRGLVAKKPAAPLTLIGYLEQDETGNIATDARTEK